MDSLIEQANYITDSYGKKIAAVIDMNLFEKMLEEIDEYYCIKEYDKAKSEKLDFVSFEDAILELKNERKS